MPLSTCYWHYMSIKMQDLILSQPHPSLTLVSWSRTLFSVLQKQMLCSNPTPTFSHTSPSVYTPTYKTPESWDCITVISNLPNTVPTHPLDILPHHALEPFDLASLLHSWPYSSHHFIEFRPYHTNGDPTELQLMARPHQTHVHTLEHSTFCYERICPTHYPYGGNK